MRFWCAGIAACLLLTTGAIVHARKIIWDGEYQKIESGSNMKRAKATIITRYDNRRFAGYTCSFEIDGEKQTLQFELAHCTRVGSHVVCTSGKLPDKTPFTGDMCWGDIYLNKKHPSELTRQ